MAARSGATRALKALMWTSRLSCLHISNSQNTLTTPSSSLTRSTFSSRSGLITRRTPRISVLSLLHPCQPQIIIHLPTTLRGEAKHPLPSPLREGARALRFCASFACLGAPLSDFRPACAPKRPSDERKQQGKDARDRENCSQPLLRDVLRSLPSRTWQCDAAKLVYETCAHSGSYERQYNRDHQS